MTKQTLKIVVALMFTSACNHDKECTPPALSNQIVGTWNASLVSEHLGEQEVTFNSNGKYSETNGLLFGKVLKSDDKWQVKNDSLIIEAMFSNGTASKYEFSVISKNCNEIVFDLDGTDQLKLEKK